MATTDPIPTALAKMEERFIERMTVWGRDLRRDLQLAMDGGFDAVHKRLDRLEQAYEMLRAGMDRLETDVGILKLDVGTLKSDVGSLKTDVGTLKSDVGTLRTDVGTLKGDVAALKLTVERLEARLDLDRSDIREQALECRRRLNALEDRVRELEGRLPPE